MAMSLGELFVTLKVKTDKSVNQAPGKLRATGRAGRSAGGGIAAMGAAFKAALAPILAIVAAVTAVVAVIAKAITAADTQVLAVNKLNIALANQGNLLPGTSQRLQEYATELQNTTRFGDEAILGVQSLLATFGAGEENIKRMTKATLDMAQAQGVDLKAAALLVGKAFAGETSSLSRYGIMVDKNLPKTQKFEEVMRQLQTRFGGTAKAATQTLGGAFAQLGNAMGDVLESVGIVIQALFDMGGGGTGGIQWLTQQVSRFATFMRQDLVIAISEANAIFTEWVANTVQGVINLSNKIGGFISIIDQDMGDALFNSTNGLQAWVKQQRINAEQIRANGEQLALNGTLMDTNNQSMMNLTGSTEAHATASQLATKHLKTFAQANAEAAQRQRELQAETEFWAQVSQENIEFIGSEVLPDFSQAYTGVGSLVALQNKQMEEAARRLGVTLVSESKRATEQQIADLKLLLSTEELTTQQREQMSTQLKELQIANEEAVAVTRGELLTTSLGAAASVLGQFAGRSKIAAIAQAGINTALAVTKTLSTTPWPLSIPLAAAAAAAGAVQIAKIKSTNASFRTGTDNLDFQAFGRETQAVLHGNEAVIPQGAGHLLAGEIARSLGPRLMGNMQPPSGGGSGETSNLTEQTQQGTQQPVNIIFELNGREMARALVPDIEDLTKRRVLRIHPAATGKEF